MSIKDMKCVLIVISLGVAGCTSEKTTPQKAASKSSKSTKANSTVGRAAGQQASPGAGTVQKEQQAPSGSTAATTARPEPGRPQVQAQATQKAAPAAEPSEEPKKPDVIFVPTPQNVVDKMLELAQVTKDDVVYDLGCGDGRIVVTAAKKYGCRSYGFDVDPQRIKESKENVETNGVGNLVTIEQKDIFTLDLSKANVVTLYLLPSLNVKLIPQLEKLKPGSRIVSHDFDMRGVTPDKVVNVEGDGGGFEHTIYLWTAPLKKEAKTDQQ
jgi:protein-L-isoaspartate O-methyltransferase